MITTVYSKPTDSHIYLNANSCNKNPSLKGIRKGVGLRLRRIYSSDNDYTGKLKEHTKYLVNRGHNLKSVQQCFNNVGETLRQEARKKVKPGNAKNLIIFSISFNSYTKR